MTTNSSFSMNLPPPLRVVNSSTLITTTSLTSSARNSGVNYTNDVPCPLLAKIFSYLSTELYTTNCFFQLFSVNKYFNRTLHSQKGCWIEREIQLNLKTLQKIKDHFKLLFRSVKLSIAEMVDYSTINCTQLFNLPNLTQLSIINDDDSNYRRIPFMLFINTPQKDILRHLTLSKLTFFAFQDTYPKILEFQNLEYLSLASADYPQEFLEQCLGTKNCKLSKLKYLTLSGEIIYSAELSGELSAQLKYLQIDLYAKPSNYNDCELLSNNLVGLRLTIHLFPVQRLKIVCFISPANVKYLEISEDDEVDLQVELNQYLSHCKQLEVLILTGYSLCDPQPKDALRYYNTLKVLKVCIFESHMEQIERLCDCRFHTLEILAIECVEDSEKTLKMLFRIFLANNANGFNNLQSVFIQAHVTVHTMIQYLKRRFRTPFDMITKDQYNEFKHWVIVRVKEMELFDQYFDILRLVQADQEEKQLELRPS